MAKKPRVKFKRNAILDLMNTPALAEEVKRRAEAVAAAANAESTWGGYVSGMAADSDRPHARVWNVKSGASDDEARNQRMLRSLDAGR